MSDLPLLQLQDVHVQFGGQRTLLRRQPLLRAVNGVSLTLRAGETLGLVGESGCGKSTLGRAALRLLTPASGSVRFGGVDLSSLPPRALRGMRRRMQLIFQDPYSSLNPTMTVEALVEEPLRIHGLGDAQQRRARVREMLELVALPADAAGKMPFAFSGGQRQRIGIARALVLEPELLVADEAVSALDVSVQAQILNLMMDLQDLKGLSYLFIAHDLSIVRHVSTRVAVMYLGKVVELAETSALFDSPQHPYTRLLLASVPIADPRRRRAVSAAAGEIASPLAPPSGCAFHPRCPHVMPRCRVEVPPLFRVSARQESACFLVEPPKPPPSGG